MSVSTTVKKQVGARKSVQQMNSFRIVMNHCHLSDLGFSKEKFMEKNNIKDHTFTNDKLDRVVASQG